MTVKAAVIAGALMFAPIVSPAQTADTTATSTDYTTGRRGFDWGWLGLLGLLGLSPKKRKEVVTETRTTTGGTGANRY